MIYLNKVYKTGTITTEKTTSVNTGIQTKIEEKIDIEIIKELFINYSVIIYTNHLKIRQTIINIYLNRNDILKLKL